MKPKVEASTVTTSVARGWLVGVGIMALVTAWSPAFAETDVMSCASRGHGDLARPVVANRRSVVGLA
ncbi:hypothetical protein [Sphingomonas albertensis]|uniref:hypothetical protein n=1 Tax=Sphingomonas albertensis TaxID=2762591 RepID=UPI0037D9A446